MFLTAESKFQRLGRREALRAPTRWREIGQFHFASLRKQCEQLIQRLTMEGNRLADKHVRLLAALESSPAEEKLHTDLVIGALFLACAAFLAFASYYFLRITLEPFRLGDFKLDIIAAAFAILTVVLTELFFRAHQESKLILRSVCATALLFLFGGLMALALVRAHLFGLLASTVQVGGTSPEAGSAGDTLSGAHFFYLHALRLLKVVLPVLTFVLDLGSGLAFHEGLERALSSDLLRYWKLKRIEKKMQMVQSRLLAHQVLPEIFEANYAAGGIQGESYAEQPDKRMALWIPVVLALIFFLVVGACEAFGQQVRPAKSDLLIIALDLTRSSDVATFDGSSEFNKNRAAMEELVKRLAEPGMSIIVLGITGRSWSQPAILLDDAIEADPGFFGERLEASRRSLIANLRSKTRSLVPSATESDVLGAALLASQLVESRKPRNPSIVFLSDMRQSGKEIDLEHSSRIEPNKDLNRARQLGLVANLKGVSVYVLGAHSAGRTALYWQSLQKFWEEYFRAAGADLRAFTALREIF
jgi:hypothetical protein